MTIEFSGINTMPTGRVPLDQVGPHAVDYYGESFPGAHELKAMPRAMRKEAALLAAEAGIDAPEGSLPPTTTTPPFRLESEFADKAVAAIPGGTPQAVTVRAFAADCLRFRKPGETGWISCADIHALHRAWCAANGHVPVESRILGMMLGRRVIRQRRGDANGYRGIALSDVARFYKPDIAPVPDDEAVMRSFAGECLSPSGGWVGFKALQDAFAAWCAMKRWPQPPAAVFRHGLSSAGGAAKRGPDGHSGYAGLAMTPLAAALAEARAAARRTAQ